MAENHSFNTSFAKKYSIEEAVIFDHLYFWCLHNKNNNTNCYTSEKENEETRKPRFWTYNSCEAFARQFDYMNKTKIYRVLKSLEDKGFIISDEFNKIAFDRTKWYAITELGESEYLNCVSEVKYCLYQNEKSIFQNETSEVSKMKNEKLQNETTIPTSITDTETDTNTTSIISELTAQLKEAQEQINALNTQLSETKVSSKKKSPSKKLTTEKDVDEYWSHFSPDTRKRFEDIYRQMYVKASELDHKFGRTKIQCYQNAIELFKYAKSSERDVSEIERVVSFGLKDSFWGSIITSPKGLIKNYEKVISRMNSSKTKSSAFEKAGGFNNTNYGTEGF